MSVLFNIALIKTLHESVVNLALNKFLLLKEVLKISLKKQKTQVKKKNKERNPTSFPGPFPLAWPRPQAREKNLGTRLGHLDQTSSVNNPYLPHF